MADRNIEYILDCLNSGDDEEFWATACELFFEDAKSQQKVGIPLYLEIGLCSHWIPPAQKRFTDTQSLPLPLQSEKDKVGYSRLMLPQYDWSMLFHFSPEEKIWKAGDLPESEFLSLRCSLPSNTETLKHAVGHAVWLKDSDISKPYLYSFKKSDDGTWDCFINPNNKPKPVAK